VAVEDRDGERGCRVGCALYEDVDMRPDGSVRTRAYNATNITRDVAMRDVQGDVWRVSDVVWR
jgi:hypothetical protein